jgi:hypothetical protein
VEYETAAGKVGSANYRIYLGGDAAGDMNLLANTQYNVTTYLYGVNKDADTRITIGTVYDPTVTNPGGNNIQKLGNSYIINPASIPEKFTIPLTQARNGWRYIDNTFRLKGQTTTYTQEFDDLITGSNWEIVTLWRTWGENANDVNVTGSKASDITTANSLTGANFYATLTFPPSIPAGNNCVIALRERTGDQKIWWTWHLWFTDYNPDGGNPDERSVPGGQIHKYFSEAFTPSGVYDGKRMMDRNLGATKTGLPADGDITAPNTTPDAVSLYGLMYQWGRKDPFTNSDKGTTTMSDAVRVFKSDGIQYMVNAGAVNVGKDYEDNSITADNNTNSVDGFPKVNNNTAGRSYRVIDAIRNPMIYFHSGTNNDWTDRDDDLWKTNVKSVFDPCPPGWRVPAGGTSSVYNPWAGFGYGLYNNTNNNTDYVITWGGNGNGPFPWVAAVQTGTAGRHYGVTSNVGSATSYTGYPGTPGWFGGDKAWYPASGFRNSYAGAFYYPGSYGYYWSSAVSSVDASHLRFFNTDVSPVYFSARGAGFSVRCVQN